jgi:hypothetical protein
MQWLRASAVACAALTALSGGSAWAGVVTVTVPDDGTTSPNGSCTQRPGVSPWQFYVTAGGSACDFRLRIDAVPGSRAVDIVSARVESRLYGAAGGFKFGLLASDGNALAGTVPVATGNWTVSTVDTTTPLKTSSGTVTMVLRSVAGAGEVWLGPPSSRRLVLHVLDIAPPRVLGPTAALPAAVAVATPVAVGARFADNGPITTAPTAVVHWGDGRSSSVTTSAPGDPFTSAVMVTSSALHAYAVPGKFSVSFDVTDTAGNVAHRELGRLRVWGTPTSMSLPRLRGKMQVGSVVTCSDGQWTEIGGAAPYTYGWLRAGKVIAGATTAAYRLTVADRDQEIRCRVSGHNPLGGAGTALSSSRRLWMAPVLVKRLRVKGHARPGSRLTCLTGTWRWTLSKVRITWVRNHRQLPNHSRRMKLRRSDRGAAIQCRVVVASPAGRAIATSRAVLVRRR